MQTDTLTISPDVLRKVAYLDWTQHEPWRIVVMCLSMGILHFFEPLMVVSAVVSSDFRGWIKRWVEDGDGVPNSIDLRNLVVNLIILWCGRGIIIAAIFQILFGSPQLDIISALGGVIITVHTGNVVTKKVLNEMK
jgi:hypothetical protein